MGGQEARQRRQDQGRPVQGAVDEEELVSSSRQLAVDRSVVNAYFKQGYSQGIEVSWASDDFKVAAWTGDGIGSRGFGPARTNSQNTPWNQTSTAYSFAARGEWRVTGEWSQFKDFNSKRGSEFGAMVGVSGAIQRANQNIGAASGTVAGGVTADLTLCFDGASIFVSGVWTNVAAPRARDDQPLRPRGPGRLLRHRGRGGVRPVLLHGLRPHERPERGRQHLQRLHGRGELVHQRGEVHGRLVDHFDSLATGAFVAGSAGFGRRRRRRPVGLAASCSCSSHHHPPKASPGSDGSPGVVGAPGASFRLAGRRS